jgi:RNA polymerase sigma-70 factor (ECF subfamily)
MNTTDREAKMVKQFQRGDTAAVQYIYQSFYRPLCYFAEKLVGDKSEAEDIAIDSIIKLLEKKDHFDTIENIEAFLYISVRNACFDFLRATQRHDISHKEIFYLTPEGEDQANNELILASILREIYVQVEALPPQCREVFKLIFFKRQSSAEVANFLGISVQTVLNQKSRAIRLLRMALLKKEMLPVAMCILWFLARA